MTDITHGNVPDLENIMEVRNLEMHFAVTKGLLKRKIGSVKAVDDVTFTIKRGQTMGIVGESGSGKTTLGHCLMSNYRITSGDIFFEHKNMRTIPKTAMRRLRKNIQMITQDPFTSLDPRMTIYDIVTEGMIIHKMEPSRAARYEAAERMLDMVGINPLFATRFPHEFSGGQRQRISIARALCVQPSFIICDEVVSALDVSIQAQIITLLIRLRRELGLTYVFIGHDLSVVRHISDNVAVMYLGKIVEMTKSSELYSNPLHPYTNALISTAPIPDPELEETRSRIILKGEVPSPFNPPRGCNFSTRCPRAMDRCMSEEPPFADAGNGHYVACHLVSGKAEQNG
jgi:oligopeptide transport system ATP-binding protein